ncbi:hypothetical protein ALO62_200155 [Pseudomonas amygdali pv. myricae]|nr:hypothetical protein ALO62_200155 [Pseudomonas amygdali pv. myricae]
MTVKLNFALLSHLEIGAILRTVNTHFILMTKYALSPTVRTNKVNMLAYKLSDRRTDKRRMLGNNMNVPAVVPMLFKASNLFNTSTNISTKSALSLIDYDNGAIWQFVPEIRGFPFDPIRL